MSACVVPVSGMVTLRCAGPSKGGQVVKGGGHDVSGVSQMDHKLECTGVSGRLQSACQDACVLWFQEPVTAAVSVYPLVPQFTGFAEGIVHAI